LIYQEKKNLLHQYMEKSYITQEQFNIALKMSSTSHYSIDNILLACGFISAEEVAKVKSIRLDTQYVDLSKFQPQEEALSLIPREKAIELTILPIMLQNGKLVIAIDAREDFKHKYMLETLTNCKITFVLSSKQEIINHLTNHKYFTQDDEILDKINILKKQSLENIDIVHLVDLLIEDAIEDDVSDIHISPEKEIINVFFRLEGVLTHYHSLPKEFHQRIVSRIKILANLDISQTQLPQDGTIEYNYLYNDYRLRVSSISTEYGENIVMRLLKNNMADLSLNSLGLTDSNKRKLAQLFKQPNGLLLITGPTGSGKTTTLYSALKEIDSLSKNIITVEDPIEYQIPFIKQTQINTQIGYNFLTAIRAFMRQDPDVILIGEIRDQETAEIALRASITGHLVFSTLHTNDAIGAIARLKDLNIPNYLIGSATIAIVAQRLIRNLCNHCKTLIKNPQEQLKKYAVQEELLKEYKEFTIYEPKGCDRCKGNGYSGRSIILEILQIDKHIEEFITESKSSIEILAYAKSQGMSDMLNDGHMKVLKGITSFEEISRVVADRKFFE